jgi:hypothetical protein
MHEADVIVPKIIACRTLCSDLIVRVLHDVGLIDCPENEGSVVVILPSISIGLFRESSSTYVLVYFVGGKPPSTKNDAAAGQDHTFIGPKIVKFHLAEILREVLHEGNALPAGNPALIRQSVEPADCMEVIFQISTSACELDILSWNLNSL